MATRSPERQQVLESKLGPQPSCANPGCTKPVNYNGGNRWGSFCAHCVRVSQGKFKPKPGITYLRKNMCGNYDGRVSLGFSCYTNWKLVKKEKARIITHMDHVDGDWSNNSIENLQELCPYCHDEKSRRNGDKDGWKNKRS
jgi:hypothetical protein